ncbi:helix-turn-helix domain-containing protein, partial [Blautia sp. AM47-4]|uniref:helix-turn-helix domain-containing protein n=1 Tax=Blautia sp. AM47-4 TaxID=2292979 RepID=UPI001FA9703F
KIKSGWRRKTGKKVMTIKEIRERSGLSQGAFCKRYGIPKGTLCHWESGERKLPSYVLNLLERVVEQDKIRGEKLYEFKR